MIRVLIGGALVLSGLPAAAAGVRGRVLVDGAGQPNVAVLLEGGVPVPPARAVEYRLDEVWLSFVPKVQALPPGSTLVFRNRDEESHTVHGYYNRQTLFNLASVPRGSEQRVELPRAGVVTITCDLHSYMRAYVLVTRSPYVAVSRLDGSFAIDGVAPGRYRVHIFRPGDPERDGEPGQEVAALEVGDAPAELTVRLAALPQAESPTPAASPHGHAHAQPPRSPVARWLDRPGAEWPHGTATVLLVAALAIVAGVVGAFANLKLVARRGGSKATALLLGCAGAFLAGLLVLFGLHGAVATALGFGLFIGTVIFAAED